MKLNLLKDSSIEASLKSITEKMVKGEQGVSRYSFKGVDKYAAYAPISGTTWSLAVSAPVQEMTGKLNSLLWSALIVLLMVLIIAVIVSVVIATGFTRPLEAMNLLLKDIAKGDLTRKLDNHSNDEFGETSQCLNTFVEKFMPLSHR
jgi:methyl-accepting chemotaxis protein